jgi:serine/threonine protein kinase
VPKSNVLIDNEGHARLANFNLLRVISEERTATLSPAESGIAQWMSPELLLPEHFDLKEGLPTKASDCYALGMVMYEILSGRTPFYQFSTYAAVLKILEGERPTRLQEPEEGRFTDGIWEMMELCWQYQPTHRTSAKAVLQYLEGGSPPSGLPPDLDRDVMMTDAGDQSDTDDQSDDASEEDECVFPFYIVLGVHRRGSIRW